MLFFFSSRRRHTRCSRDWSSDVCSSDLKRRGLSTSREAAPRIIGSYSPSAECQPADRKSTRLNSSHGYISYAVFCLKKKKKTSQLRRCQNQSTPLQLTELIRHHDAVVRQ